MRTLSVPSRGDGAIPKRVRSFSIRGGRLLSEGDSWRTGSTTTATFSCSDSAIDLKPSKVLLVGARGVGKTSLAQQLITSETLVNGYCRSDTSFGKLSIPASIFWFFFSF